MYIIFIFQYQVNFFCKNYFYFWGMRYGKVQDNNVAGTRTRMRQLVVFFSLKIKTQ
jgi:hypothetical protein